MGVDNNNMINYFELAGRETKMFFSLVSHFIITLVGQERKNK